MATENMTTPEQTEPSTDENVSLKEQLLKSEQKRDELLRTLAEYENSRRRGNRDLELERKFAHAKFVGDLLPALDNLDRALAAATEAGENSGLVKGVLATQAQLLGILKQHAVVAIEAAWTAVRPEPASGSPNAAQQRLPSQHGVASIAAWLHDPRSRASTRECCDRNFQVSQSPK